MDGVPFITQCPIPSYTTFQYKFRASAPGTHYWHAHSGSSRADGFFGAFVVRQPERLEPHRKLYDIDDKNHVILISEWGQQETPKLTEEVGMPKSLLINGKAPNAVANTLTVFDVKKGKRYRFRVAYTGGILGCPVTLTIDQHVMKIISLDGNPTNPHEVSSIVLSKGERVDFVLKTSRDVGAYFVTVKSECNDRVVEGVAVLNYEGATKENVKIQDAPINSAEVNARKFSTAVCQTELGKVCLGDVSALNKMPQELRMDDVGRQIYLHFDYKLTEDVGGECLFTLLCKNNAINLNNMRISGRKLQKRVPISQLIIAIAECVCYTESESITMCIIQQAPLMNRSSCNRVHLVYIAITIRNNSANTI